MCGRFTLKTNPDLWAQLLLPLVLPSPPDSWKPRYNVAPTQKVVSLIRGEDDLSFEALRWGLVPFWAQELAIGNRMINARCETLAEKRSFSKLLSNRRCVILADGYYEWQKLPGGKKRPCWITPADDGLMLMAGLWDSNKRATCEEVRTCTIITVAANDALCEIHDRMPAILNPQGASGWLHPQTTASEAQSLLGTVANDQLKVREVSTLVNNPKNDSPACIEQVA